MRMILMIGIMLLVLLPSLPALPSLLLDQDTDRDSVYDTSRSTILRTILSHSQDRQAKEVSKRNVATVNVPYRLDCCPSETYLNHPRGGISVEGKLLEIYRDNRTVQKFYQTSCRPEVENRPCPLVDAEVRHASRCVQKYSYVYAIVRDYNVSERFRLDYIRVNSGCSCELDFSYAEVIEFR